MSHTIPVLRFKNDEGHDYPDWEERKISHFLQEKNIKQESSKNIPLMAFVANKGIVEKGKRYDRNFLVKSEHKKYKRTDLNDFIYSSNNLDVGSIGMNEYGSVVISVVYNIFEIKTNGSPIFISEYLKTKNNIAKYLKYRQGCLYGQYKIPSSDFLNIRLFFPSLVEQEKIANFLEVVNNKIKILQEKLDNLLKLKNELLRRIFSQEIRFKDENGNEFPAWETKELGEIGQFIRGHSYNKNDLIHNINNGVIVIRSTNLEMGKKVDFSKELQIVKKPCQSQQILRQGDLCICTANGNENLVGKTSVFKDTSFKNATVGAFCCIFRSDHPITFYLFQTREYLEQLKTKKQGGGGSITNIKVTDLENFSFKIPSIEESKKIKSFLELLDEKEELTKKSIKNWELLKKGLLQQLFPN